MNWEKLTGGPKAGQAAQWTDPFNKGGRDITDNLELLAEIDSKNNQQPAQWTELNNIKLASFFIVAIIILILLFKHKERAMDFVKQNKKTIILISNSLLVLFLFSIVRDSINFRMLIAISIAVFNGVSCIKNLTSKEFMWISYTANALLIVLSLEIERWAYIPWRLEETYRVIVSLVAIVNMAYTYSRQRKIL